ncbi:putative DD34D transposase [Trichonephila clavipes]|nr:putative DD34D transposase [Trichonephila clavipes]
MMDRISICEALAKRNEIDPFLKRMVTGDEKLATYSTILCKNDHGQRVISTVRSDLLDRLKLAIDQKRPELANRRDVFHQDNAMPHTSVVTRQNIWELGWEVLMHPPYSTNLAPQAITTIFPHCKTF